MSDNMKGNDCGTRFMILLLFTLFAHTSYAAQVGDPQISERKLRGLHNVPLSQLPSVSSGSLTTKERSRCLSSELMHSKPYSSPVRSHLMHGLTTNKDSKVFRLDTDTTCTFYVRNVFDQTKWDSVVARKLLDSTKLRIWLDMAALGSILTVSEIDTIVRILSNYLLRFTDQYSVDASVGIMDIMSNYFGNPPNIGGDGKLDIVLLDIRDSFDQTGSYVAGFFDPNDVTNNPYSNKRDIIFIDLYPTIKYGNAINVKNAASTISHEYQHLIHANYEGKEQEYVFMNEGLSEFAETVCGFWPRSVDPFLVDHERPLLSWNYQDPIPDYCRAELWTHYLFEQIGYEHIRQFVQWPLTGLSAITRLLEASSSKSFEQMFADWNIANVVNDVRISPAYGYRHPLRKNFKMTPLITTEVLPTVTTLTLPNLSCQCVSFPSTQSLVFDFDTLPVSVHASTVSQYPSGIGTIFPSVQLRAGKLSASEQPYGTIIVLLSNTTAPQNEDDLTGTAITYMASGKKSGQSVVRKYDDDVEDAFSDNASYLLIHPNEAIAVAFFSEESSWLDAISFKVIFLSEVIGSGISTHETRDLFVQVYDVRNGMPHSPLTEKRQFVSQREFGTLGFEMVPMADFYQALSTLKDTFCVVLSNDNAHKNYFAIGMDNSQRTHSFVGRLQSGTDLSWQSFAVTNVDTTNLVGWNAMIRAHCIMREGQSERLTRKPMFGFDFQSVTMSVSPPFVVDTTHSRCVIKTPSARFVKASVVEQTADLIRYRMPFESKGTYSVVAHLSSVDFRSDLDTALTWCIPAAAGFTVGTNYPNPFNPSTIFPFIAWEDGVMELEVYNILGQKVFSTEPRTYLAGNHRFELDLRAQSSGIYFARLVFAVPTRWTRIVEVRKLVLLK